MKKSILYVVAIFLFAACDKSLVESDLNGDASQEVSQRNPSMNLKKGVDDKVTIRHNGKLIEVSANALDIHFGHGDQLIVRSGDLAVDNNDVLETPTKWFFYNDETDIIDNSLGSFVAGPGTPPYGNGSAKISVTGTQRRNLATYQFAGIKLMNFGVLAYSTYNPSAGNGGSANRSGYLNFNVTFNGIDTWQRRLIFIPSDNGVVLQNQWQEWDLIDGGNALWRYSGANWPSPIGGSGSSPKTWAQILAAFPNVAVRTNDSWLGIRVGEPYSDGYTENIDGFKFGIKTFDFEN